MRFTLTALVIVLSSFAAQGESDEPFGVTTVPVPEHSYAVNWRKVRGDWVIERKILDRCRVEHARCPREALQLLGIIDEARIERGRAQLGHVNRAINLAIRPIKDIKNYGVPEIWTAPLATLAKGAGDCTDYALAKYFVLGEVGISANNRRLVIVQVKPRLEEHAVLAVRENENWIILDNRHMTIVNTADATDYVPLLILDHYGIRQVIRPALGLMTKAVCGLGAEISGHSDRPYPK